jgi:DNA-binding CsgD family transcriptional regulator
VPAPRADAARAFAAGALGYLLKSDSGQQLRRALETIRRGRRWLSPAIAGGDPEALLSRLREPEGRGHPPGPRAREVIRLLAQGHSMKEAAWRLGITPRTVAFHKYGAMQSLGIGSSAELVRHALEAGWLVGDEGRARESADRERSRTVVTDPPGWLGADPVAAGERLPRQALAGMDEMDASWRAACIPAVGSSKRPRRTRG